MLIASKIHNIWFYISIKLWLQNTSKKWKSDEYMRFQENHDVVSYVLHQKVEFDGLEWS